MSVTVTWVKRQPRVDSNHSIERCFGAIESGFSAQGERPFVITSAVCAIFHEWSLVHDQELR